MTAIEKVRLSYADYLVLERASAGKHEYLRGEVFAMAGGTIEHARLQAALARELGVALAGRPCNYVRVSQNEPRIEVYSNEAGRWVLSEAVSGGCVQVTSLGVGLRVDPVVRDLTG